MENKGKTMSDILITYAPVFFILMMILIGCFLVYNIYKSFKTYQTKQKLILTEKEINDLEAELDTVDARILDVGLFYLKMVPETSEENDSLSYKKITKRIIKLSEQILSKKTLKTTITKKRAYIEKVNASLKYYIRNVFILLAAFIVTISVWQSDYRLKQMEEVPVLVDTPTLLIYTDSYNKNIDEYVVNKDSERETDSKKKEKLIKDAYTVLLGIDNTSSIDITQMFLSFRLVDESELEARFAAFDSQFIPQKKKNRKNNDYLYQINVTVPKEQLTKIEIEGFEKASIAYLYYTNAAGDIFKKELVFVTGPKNIKEKELLFLSDKEQMYGFLNGNTYHLSAHVWELVGTTDQLWQFKSEILAVSETTVNENEKENSEQVAQTSVANEEKTKKNS